MMDSIKFSLDFDYRFFVDRVGLSGSFCIFWNKDIDISLLGYFVGHTDVSIILHSCVVFRFTGLYGNP